MKIKIFLFSLAFLTGSVFSANAQYAPNIDFEMGTHAYWSYFKGTVSMGPVYTLASCPATLGYHTLTSGSDTDYYGGFPVVAPGSTFSLKLGDDGPHVEAERARYFLHIPTGGDTIYNIN